MKIADIDVDLIFSLLLEILQGAHDPYVWGTWFKGFENSVADVLPAGTAELRVRAIMKVLGKHGYVYGCHCGCRGDYELTEKGVEYAYSLTCL